MRDHNRLMAPDASVHRFLPLPLKHHLRSLHIGASVCPWLELRHLPGFVYLLVDDPGDEAGVWLVLASLEGDVLVEHVLVLVLLLLLWPV